MGTDFGLDNVEKRIHDLQREGWKVTEILEKRFEFRTPSGMGYSRPYSNLDDLVPMEILASEDPEIDVRAEYFSRLYLTYWKDNGQKQLIE